MTCNNKNEMLLLSKEKVDAFVTDMSKYFQSVIDNQERFDSTNNTYLFGSLHCLFRLGLIGVSTYNDILELRFRALNVYIDSIEEDMLCDLNFDCQLPSGGVPL